LNQILTTATVDESRSLSTSEVNVDAELVRCDGNITYGVTYDNGITVDCL
jgi:hypothetical protein